MNLDNSYARLPTRFYERLDPAGSTAPTLLAWNRSLADELNLGDLGDDPERLAQWFGGNTPLPGAEPIALAYAGHQFGHFVPQLGDGRALLLGELACTRDGRRYDVQLKGSGRTPFSRNGDGKAALGPVIREYLVSEAMHRLGVPTTRALAAVATGEFVQRETLLPGGVLTRVAASHIRVGTFEFFAVRGDVDALQMLVDYAIERHYPDAATADSPVMAFFNAVVERQAELIAQWMAIGFIHGVMNTDNMAISGETIDYGPCAFMDEFEYDKVFSSIDHNGRYAYAEQAGIAMWNLTRLAECLLRLVDDRSGFESGLMHFQQRFQAHYIARMAQKIGLLEARPGDETLIIDWLDQLQERQLDFTLSFRRLADRLEADDDSAFGAFETRWRARLAQQARSPQQTRDAMNAVNPLYIPRNHQIERAIQGAIGGDLSVFGEMQQVLQTPFTAQAGFSAYAEAPSTDERVRQTFCGT